MIRMRNLNIILLKAHAFCTSVTMLFAALIPCVLQVLRFVVLRQHHHVHKRKARAIRHSGGTVVDRQVALVFL